MRQDLHTANALGISSSRLLGYPIYCILHRVAASASTMDWNHNYVWGLVADPTRDTFHPVSSATHAYSYVQLINKEDLLLVCQIGFDSVLILTILTFTHLNYHPTSFSFSFVKVEFCIKQVQIKGNAKLI